MVKDTPFKSEEAPCGQIMDGERHEDRVAGCRVTDERSYACGCQVIRHEYHDGTFARKVVRHDGKVLVDRMNTWS